MKAARTIPDSPNEQSLKGKCPNEPIANKQGGNILKRNGRSDLTLPAQLSPNEENLFLKQGAQVSEAKVKTRTRHNASIIRNCSNSRRDDYSSELFIQRKRRYARNKMPES